MPMNEIQLRDYQQECVDIINNTESGSYLVAVATGLGKTVIFSHIARRGRMLILSHREELVWQPKKYFDCSYGVEKADIHSDGEEVVSASVQTLVRRLESFSPDDFDIIITDEAHHAVAPTYKKIYEYFKPRLHIGFTATPNRADNVKLGEIYSSIIFERNLKWGIKNNYLSNIRCLKIDIGYDISEVSSQNGDLNVGELSSAMDIQKQNKAIAEAYQKYAVGQTLIFATSVNHARNIAMEIPGARVVTGETENRDEIIADFTARKIPCIVNCMVFTEGTDMPLIETVIIARPTRNASLYAQMVGRGLRLHEGKKELLLMDCVGVTGKIKLCTAPSLFGISEVPASIPQEGIEGQLITDIEDRIKYEMNKPQDWQINAHLVDIFEEENSYDTHDVNYVMLPDGDMVCSYDRNCCIRVESEDMTGNSRAVLYENKLPVKTTVRMYMQNVLDFVYNFLVNNFPNNHKLWDMKSVRKWGGQPASDAQKRLIYRNRKKLSDLDIDYDKLTKYEASVIINRIHN